MWEMIISIKRCTSYVTGENIYFTKLCYAFKGACHKVAHHTWWETLQEVLRATQIKCCFNVARILNNLRPERIQILTVMQVWPGTI